MTADHLLDGLAAAVGHGGTPSAPPAAGQPIFVARGASAFPHAALGAKGGRNLGAAAFLFCRKGDLEPGGDPRSLTMGWMP